MPPNTLERSEAVRRATMQFLAGRQALAFTAEDVAGRLRDARKFDDEVETSEVENSLVFLTGHKWVDQVPSQIGGRIFYRATSAGVLVVEQKQI
jgi:hypothetical protein